MAYWYYCRISKRLPSIPLFLFSLAVLILLIVPYSFYLLTIPLFERHLVGRRMILPDSPLGVFQLFFTMKVIEMIVEQTNLYAYQCTGNTSFEAWQKVTAAELEAFFGFMILMGIVRLPSLLDYWKNDVTFHYIHYIDLISNM